MSALRRIAAMSAAWLILTPLVLADEAAPAASPTVTPPAVSPSVEQLTERVRKSVAVIVSDGRNGQREGLGSGFVVADGLIATNFHVIGEGRGVRVQLADGREFEATAIHASDRALDLAILRIDASDLPVLELGNSDELKQGQSVLALGNPRGLKNSVVAGLVSGVREMDGRPMVQLAIPIEPGNSGGPLIDMQGRVHGVLTMKSLVTPNLGFALTINLLKPLLEKPNPILMSRWLTIGALDPHEWKPTFGARWRQRSGHITVEGQGQGFGGRSLCLSEAAVPDRPCEMTVTVQMNDEAGAAGLAFCAEGDKHYGFYPTNGHLRLTRFEGPDVASWTILYDQPSRHYVAGSWNTLRVRLEEGKILCFVNDQPVVEVADSGLTGGKAGLVKFRQTQAQFKGFKVGREVTRVTVPASEAQRIEKLVGDGASPSAINPKIVSALAGDAAYATTVLRDRAAALDAQAARLRELAQATHEERVTTSLAQTLSGDDDKIDLFRAGLLVARLDNEEVDVDGYCEEINRLAHEISAKVPAEADEPTRLETLRKYLFEENGFHGSRGDYDSRSNSYLNEVLDDREGLPITLSIVYMELAHRLGLHVVGIGLPGHFVVEHRPAKGEGQLIDVYEGAKLLTRAEAERRVKAAIDREPTPEHFAAMTKRAIIVRMLGNLLNTSGNEPRAAHRYVNAILAIDPENGQFHWIRAVVRSRLDRRDEALEDLAWLTDHKPAGVDLERVEQLQQILQHQ